jgi:3-oxoacyl-[acyl-carrier protein] reductase
MMLTQKTALVTGASRGIGRAIALTLGSQGAVVGINYHQHTTQAQQVLKTLDGKGTLLQADVSQKDQVSSMIDAFIDQYSHLDILVHNAGIYQRQTIETLSFEQWKKILAVNLDSCYHLVHSAAPFMNKDGRIIFISSQLAFKGTPHGADYATSKAGMLGFMRSLALELAPRGITVNAIAPGTIDTDLIGNYSKEKRKQRAQEIPLGRLGTPEDIADVCVFLASHQSRYITGETIHVNGGLYIH